MPLRLVNKQRTHTITVCGTEFKIISMTIGEKEKLVYDIQNVGSDNGAFDRLLDVITPVITQIAGYDSPVRTILGQLEDIAQLREIIQAIITHCSLTESESKNLPSSSEQPTPASAGNVVKNAVPDDGPVSITPTPTDL